ncbi:hypothetical protein D3C83_286160 [compost metagenome]
MTPVQNTPSMRKPSVTWRMLRRSPASSSAPSGVNGVVIAVHSPRNCARDASLASDFR